MQIKTFSYKYLLNNENHYADIIVMFFIIVKVKKQIMIYFTYEYNFWAKIKRGEN